MTDRVTRSAILAALTILPNALVAQPVTKDGGATTGATAGATAAAITPADLRRRVEIFAHDSMLGREAGTADNLRATDYIEREVRRLGLVPAGDSGGYFQYVPLTRRGLRDDASLRVGATSYAPGRDFLARDNGASQRAIDGAPAVYGGTWGDTASFIDPDAAAGKLVIVGVPRGWQANRPALNARFAAAAGIAIASFDAMPAEVREGLAAPVIAMPSDAPEPAGAPVPAFLYVSKALATALLGASVDRAPKGIGQTVHGSIAFETRATPTRNVVAVLPGSDPALKGQYVAVGAHNDHLGFTRQPLDHDSVRAVLTVTRPMGADSPERPITAAERSRIRTLADSLRRAHGGARPDSIYNGADDDASGSMAALEIAEHLASLPTRPRRSVVFVWHTAEEIGLFGSEWFTDHPTVPRDSIVAQLNMDMIGRGSRDDMPDGGPQYVQLIGTRRLSTELGDLVERVNRETRAGFTFDYQFDANGHPEQYYCRSDHYEYARYGIPVAFFSTGGHRDYHQVTDEAQYLDYPKYARVTTLVRDIAMRVANLDRRVAVDKPKPDPRGQCVQ